MIDIKAAVRNAVGFVQALYEYDQKKVRDLLLEGVELSDDERFWILTLSFNRVRPPEGALEDLTTSAPVYERVYKVVEVERETGEAVSMKSVEV